VNVANLAALANQIPLLQTDISPYQIVALGFALLGLGMAFDEWRRNDNRECRRLALAFAAILVLRLADLLAFPAPGLPAVAPFVESVSLILALWAFTRPLFDNPERADQAIAGVLGVAVLGEGATWVAWAVNRPALSWPAYADHWSLVVWLLAQVGLAALGVWLVVARRSEQRVVLAGAFGLAAAGNIAALFGYAAFRPVLDVLFYPLLAVATYQMITVDLRSFGHELRAISERSLRHTREQVLLMELGRAAAESLERSHIMDVIAKQSGVAFDADQVVLLLDEKEQDAGRLQVAARYYALDDTRADSLQSHVYLRDAQLLKNAVRSRRQFILSHSADAGSHHDLAAVQQLLGMESLAHAMIEPLIFKDEVIGLLVAARLRGRPPFSEDEGRLFTAMGGLLTSTLQNSRLYQSLKSANEELQRLNEDLRATELQLREMDRLKSSFIGLVTHELRSPFVDLDLSLQLLRRYGVDGLPAAQREQLAQLELGIGRARRMVDSLVSFASLLSRQGTLHLEPVDFSEIVRQVVESLAGLASDREVQIAVQAGSEQPICVEGDKGRLSEAVHHLVHNAIKFNRAGGRVDVRYWVDETQLSFEVEDTGIGIAPAKLETIWEQFSQVADPYRRGVEGLGLGLALVRLVVEAHGGRVAAQSVEGAGSSFGFQVPLRQHDSNQPSAASDQPAAKSSR